MEAAPGQAAARRSGAGTGAPEQSWPPAQQQSDAAAAAAMQEAGVEERVIAWYQGVKAMLNQATVGP